MTTTDKKTQVTEALNSVVNPLTKQSLVSENRITEIAATDTALKITYNRDGLSPQDKRQIEDQIIQSMGSIYHEDSITVFTVSTNNKDIYRAEAQAPKPAAPAASAPTANLKTGHGPTGAKKRRVEGVGKVIAISSCKGGVGKSTVSVNLALTLKKQGFKVGLIDADVYGPSIPMLLGKRDAKPGATDDKKIIPIEAFGVKFISFGLFIGESDPVIWRGPMLGGVLNQFLFDVAWGELDYLLIDLPPGTGDMQLSMVQATEVDGAVIISTPQQVALLDTVKGLKMFNQVNIPVIGMVENMSFFAPSDSDKRYYIFGKDGVENAARELEIPFLGGIPLEIELREGSDTGRPYMEQNEYQGRLVWNAYMALGEKIHKIFNKEEKKKSIFTRIFK
jgi:ATP-binding protein involved in chromosome partitioning